MAAVEHQPELDPLFVDGKGPDYTNSISAETNQPLALQVADKFELLRLHLLQRIRIGLDVGDVRPLEAIGREDVLVGVDRVDGRVGVQERLEID